MPMNEQELMELLRREIEAVGSQKEFAEKHSISQQYINDVLADRRMAGKKVLDALGVERVVTYRQKGSE